MKVFPGFIILIGMCFPAHATVNDPVDAIVELANGDRIHAKIKLRTDSELTVDHTVLGELKIKNDQIEQILDTRHQPLIAENLPQEPDDMGLFGSGMLIGWQRKFELGVNGAQGGRNITTADWSHQLDYYEGMAFKLGIYNEYDSAQTSSNRNDFRYHASIVWGL